VPESNFDVAGNSGGAGGLLHHLKFSRWCIAPPENWGQNQKILEISHLKKKIIDEKVYTLHK